MRWILKGNRPKILEVSLIFISRLELGKIEWKNHLERQNGAAEIFFHKIENSLRWILEGFWYNFFVNFGHFY